MAALIDQTHPLIRYPIRLEWAPVHQCPNLVFERLFGYGVFDRGLAHAREQVSRMSMQQAAEAWQRITSFCVATNAWIFNVGQPYKAFQVKDLEALAWVTCESLCEVDFQSAPSPGIM